MGALFCPHFVLDSGKRNHAREVPERKDETCFQVQGGEGKVVDKCDSLSPYFTLTRSYIVFSAFWEDGLNWLAVLYGLLQPFLIVFYNRTTSHFISTTMTEIWTVTCDLYIRVIKPGKFSLHLTPGVPKVQLQSFNFERVIIIILKKVLMINCVGLKRLVFGQIGPTIGFVRNCVEWFIILNGIKIIEISQLTWGLFVAFLILFFIIYFFIFHLKHCSLH